MNLDGSYDLGFSVTKTWGLLRYTPFYNNFLKCEGQKQA